MWGSPPFPHEHGAWLMLYLPASAGVVACARVEVLPLILYVLALTAAFFGQNATGIVVRGRGGDGARRWMLAYATVFAASGLALVALYGRWMLAPIALPGVALLVYQILRVWPSHRRVDRSASTEIATACVLCLTAPSATVEAQGVIGESGWILYVACALFFTGGVAHVKYRIQTAIVHVEPPVARRLRRTVLVLHGAMAAGCFTLWAAGLPVAALLGTVACVPAWVRAVRGGVGATGILSVRRLGLQETGVAVWFTALVSIGVRTIS